jgi:D-sedoheptulose 7-phosphate isomerase
MSQKVSRVEFARNYISHLSSLFQKINLDSLDKVIELFTNARDEENTIFFVGNGGSAATACHFANDMGFCASPEGRKPIRAISLASNVSFLTCLANDIGYENVFSWQLRNLMRPGDIVVGISAGGNSPNVVKALEYANAHGGVSVALVGFDGGTIKKIANYVVHIETEIGDYGPVEDLHIVMDHLITKYLADQD